MGQRRSAAEVISLPLNGAEGAVGLPDLIASVRALSQGLTVLDGRLTETAAFIDEIRRACARFEARLDEIKAFRVGLECRLSRIELALGVEG